MMNLQLLDQEIRSHIIQLQQRINDLPPETQMIIGLVPGVGNLLSAALSATQLTMQGYSRLATHYKNQNRLSPAALLAFDEYESAQVREKVACARFLKEFHAFLASQPRTPRFR
jgi:hypothetical protein